MKWIKDNKRAKSTVYICPACFEKVYYIPTYSRRKGLLKDIDYRYCPYCANKIEPEVEVIILKEVVKERYQKND